MANKKYTVNHKKQYLSVGGKLQKVPFGTEVTLDEKSAEALVENGKLVLASGSKSLDLTKAPTKAQLKKLAEKEAAEAAAEAAEKEAKPEVKEA